MDAAQVAKHMPEAVASIAWAIGSVFAFVIHGAPGDDAIAFVLLIGVGLFAAAYAIGTPVVWLERLGYRLIERIAPPHAARTLATAWFAFLLAFEGTATFFLAVAAYVFLLAPG